MMNSYAEEVFLGYLPSLLECDDLYEERYYGGIKEKNEHGSG